MVNLSEKEKSQFEQIEDWKRSGKSAKAWCLENQVVYKTFMGWRKRFQNSNQNSDQQANPVPFMELKALSPANTGISLECAGVKIHLASDFDISTLRRCLDALRGTNASFIL